MPKLISRIDRYIIKKFIGTFVFSILIIISIAIIFDFAERLDDFLERKAPFDKILFEYYLNFIPYFVNLFTPLFVFISVIFFTSKLAQRSEIIAMLSSGINFNRILYPYFLSAFIIAVFTWFSSNFFVPRATKKKLAFEEIYIRNPFRNKDIHIHRQIEPGVFVYMENFAVEGDIAYRFSMEKFDNKQLVSKLFTDYAQWDSIKQRWKLINCFIRNFQENGETIIRHAMIDTAINLRPEEFKRRTEFVETMDFYRLNQYIEQKRMEGDENVVHYEVVRYQRFFNPLSIFVLTLIGVSVSSRKKRGGIGAHLGLGLGLSFSYIVFLQVSTYMAIGGSLPSWLGVSLPTIIFSIIAIFMYIKVPK
ncbi:MAG: LptF/LptG family permease [Bacteroidales bacterium]|nr:LptF/LptG family permease [Bacteroidales bacterium]